MPFDAWRGEESPFRGAFPRVFSWTFVRGAEAFVRRKGALTDCEGAGLWAAARARRRARGGRTFRSRRGGRGRRPGSARSFGASVPYPAEPGLRKGLRPMSRPQAEHGGRISLHPWNGRRRGRRGAYGKERNLTCLGCRNGWGAWCVRWTVHPGRRKIQPAVPEMSHEGRRGA